MSNSKICMKLSKSVLDMKFMKKTKEKVDKEADDAKGEAMYSQDITEEMRKSGQTMFVYTSMLQCHDLIDGRLSFGGMNPLIENIMLTKYKKKLDEAEKKKEKEISDADMAEGLDNTISKKFNNKKNKNKKFIKPQPSE